MGHFAVDHAAWLKDVPTEAVAALEKAARIRTLAPGQRITQIGDEPAGLIGIDHGAIAIHTDDTEELDVIGHVFWPGDWYGVATILSDTPRFVGSSALTDARVLDVSRTDVLRIANSHPLLWRGLAVMAGMGTHVATQIARASLLPTAREKCVATLLKLVGHQPLPCELPLTQTQFAGICGLSRGAVAKALSELERSGEAGRGYASIIVPKVSRTEANQRSGVS